MKKNTCYTTGVGGLAVLSVIVLALFIYSLVLLKTEVQNAAKNVGNEYNEWKSIMSSHNVTAPDTICVPHNLNFGVIPVANPDSTLIFPRRTEH